MYKMPYHRYTVPVSSLDTAMQMDLFVILAVGRT
jgi:hypothetical protein